MADSGPVPLQKKNTIMQINQARLNKMQGNKMNGLVSYDILDNPGFKQSQKIEKRMISYYQRVKDIES